MENDSVTLCSTNSCCNKTPHCVSWGDNGYIVYAASNACVLYKFAESCQTGRIFSTNVGHTDRVNSVRWIKCDKKETEFLSASTDKTAAVWKFDPVSKEVTQISQLTGHTSSVTIIEGLYAGGRTIVVSASVDSTVKVWVRKNKEGEFNCDQTISFNTGFALDLSLNHISKEKVPILACGCDDHRIHIFVEQQNKFIRMHSLTGHEDWIRGLEFRSTGNEELLLASCAQDNYIRIWKFKPQEDVDLSQNDELRLKENTFDFSTNDQRRSYAVVLESVLSGHDNWVYAVHWRVLKTESGEKVTLLTASMDKTMIVWEQDADSEMWLESVRVGEVGGNTLGLYGCQSSPDGKAILAHGFQGGFHLWRTENENDIWNPGVMVSGHFDGIEDLSWDPIDGDFIVTTSSDETTRLFAPWVTEYKKDGSKVRQITWHEIARPQIHGYHLQCLAMCGKFQFASGADEKIVRIFDAPKNFIENFGRLCDIDITKYLSELEEKNLPEGASIPSLGLSNKAIFGDEKIEPVEGTEFKHNREAYFTVVSLEKPPPEDHLLQNTLWPETQKLYGHGFEMFSLACHPVEGVLASACKASKEEHANIILWDTKTWSKCGDLKGHSLTITQMAFSHDGKYLLSVSRDRTWCLFKRRSKEDSSDSSRYLPCAIADKKSSLHSRVIWSCAWSHDDKYFVTVARDKKAVVWKIDESQNNGNLGPVKSCGKPLELKDSITAVDFAPILVKNEYLLGFGLDCGTVHLYSWSESEGWKNVSDLEKNLSHHKTVKRLKFRPRPGNAEGSEVLQFATCGSDYLMRIYNVKL